MRDFSIYIHPRLFALHSMPDICGTYRQDGSVILPPWEPLSQESLSSDGCYLLDNVFTLFLWVGRALSENFLQEVFGVTSLRSSEARYLELRNNPTEDDLLLSRILSIINGIRQQHASFPRLYIIKQGSEEELPFTFQMRNDRVEGTMSQLDLLVFLKNKTQGQ